MAPNPDRVLIFDTTLRDGEAIARLQHDPAEKLRVRARLRTWASM